MGKDREGGRYYIERSSGEAAPYKSRGCHRDKDVQFQTRTTIDGLRRQELDGSDDVVRTSTGWSTVPDVKLDFSRTDD